VYDMIVKRFLATFAEPALKESVAASIRIGDEGFSASGAVTIEENWIAFYKPYARHKEQALPELREGQVLRVRRLGMLSKMTQPPARYSQGGLLKKLEELNLGTKGTRALILQTLYDREYIRDSTIVVTELGNAVVEALKKSCPEIVSIDLTRRFQEETEDILLGKRKKEEIIQGAKEELGRILAKFKESEKHIGTALLSGVRQALQEERMNSIIGKCICGGNLMVRTSRDNKRFIGCDAYPKCRQTFSLPQKGRLVMLEKKCLKCGLNIVQVRQYRKRPYELCVRDGFVPFRKSAEGKA